MRLPIFSRIGRARSNAVSEPPHMKASVPASAPETPPDTGASRKSKPAFSAAACTARAESMSMVEQSIRSAPLGAALKMLSVSR